MYPVISQLVHDNSYSTHRASRSGSAHPATSGLNINVTKVRKETSGDAIELAKEHSGAYGVGLSTLTMMVCIVRLPTRKLTVLGSCSN